MTQSQRQALYNQFKHMDNNELTQIINDNSYDALAKEVAQDLRFIKNSMIAGGVIAAIVIAVFIILILLH